MLGVYEELLNEIFKGQSVSKVGIGVPTESVTLGGDRDRERTKFSYINLYFTVGVDVGEEQDYIVSVRGGKDDIRHYNLKDKKCRFCGEEDSSCSYLNEYNTILVSELKGVMEKRLSYLK